LRQLFFIGSFKKMPGSLLTSSPSTPGYSPRLQQRINHHGIDPAFLPGSPLRTAGVVMRATLEEEEVTMMEIEEAAIYHHCSTSIKITVINLFLLNWNVMTMILG
jgi:hypothetical protein